MKDRALRTELERAKAQRAGLYYLIFLEVRNAPGEYRAIEIMKQHFTTVAPTLPLRSNSFHQAGFVSWATTTSNTPLAVEKLSIQKYSGWTTLLASRLTRITRLTRRRSTTDSTTLKLRGGLTSAQSSITVKLKAQVSLRKWPLGSLAHAPASRLRPLQRPLWRQALTAPL